MSSTALRQTLLLVWPLLAGIVMITTGNGLQGTLLGLRAMAEGFPVFATGIVMSMYYCGFLLGCFIVPRAISSVGHIRVFAASASLASTTILLHGLLADPLPWAFVRALSGLSFAGLFIVAESWLNNIATNKLRAQIFGAYIGVVHGGLFIGQFLITLAPVTDFTLFVLISVLISLSVLPLTLANKPAPGHHAPEHLPFGKLFKRSPLSIVAVFCSGLCGATILTLGAVYAQQAGFATPAIASFVASYVLGAATLPFFIGWLSDRIDRRKMIIALALCAFACAAVVSVNSALAIPGMIVLGGMVVSIYSIAIAYMNDQLKPGQIVSATASMILVNSMGACIGPLLIGGLMEWGGNAVFFPSFAALYGLLVLLGLVRAAIGERVDVAAQGEFVAMPARSSPGVMQITKGES